jgi:hypothetical protein
MEVKTDIERQCCFSLYTGPAFKSVVYLLTLYSKALMTVFWVMVKCYTVRALHVLVAGSINMLASGSANNSRSIVICERHQKIFIYNSCLKPAICIFLCWL